MNNLVDTEFGKIDTHKLPSKAASGGIGIPIQPQNLQPTVCSNYDTCRGKAETKGMANWWLVQLETHGMRGSPPLTWLRGLGTRSWKVQGSIVEQNTSGKKKLMKWFLMIFCCTQCLAQLSSEMLHPATDGNRCRLTHSQTTGRTWGILWKRGRKDGNIQKGSRTTQENPQNQLTWAIIGAHRDWTVNKGACMGVTKALCTCYSCVAWSSCGTANSENMDSLWLFCLPLGPFPPTGLPYLDCLILIGEEEGPNLTATWYARAGWYPWEACPFLKRNREVVDGGGWAEGSWRGETGRREGRRNCS